LHNHDDNDDCCCGDHGDDTGDGGNHDDNDYYDYDGNAATFVNAAVATTQVISAQWQQLSDYSGACGADDEEVEEEDWCGDCGGGVIEVFDEVGGDDGKADCVMITILLIGMVVLITITNSDTIDYRAGGCLRWRQ